MNQTETPTLADAVLRAYRTRGWTVATAESCTGGLVAAALTEVAGSSDVVDRGFVTYSNAAKTAMLGVDATLIARVGAVSEAVARAMASGALTAAGVAAAVSITGIAGPGGGSAEKPIGTVCFGLAVKGRPVWAERQQFDGDRSEVRRASVTRALQLLLQAATAD